MIEDLQRELKEVTAKRDMLQTWLCNNTQHPDFIKIAGDRNHLTIKIEGLEFKISQLEKGLPILGEPEPLMTIIELEKLHNKLN